MAEPLGDREEFENSYYYFVLALKTLAASADEKAIEYGSSDEGAAWELKNDVAAGIYLFNFESCSLSDAQRGKITELVNVLNGMPKNNGFKDPSWVPLQKRAEELLKLLEPITRANTEYFGS